NRTEEDPFPGRGQEHCGLVLYHPYRVDRGLCDEPGAETGVCTISYWTVPGPDPDGRRLGGRGDHSRIGMDRFHPGVPGPYLPLGGGTAQCHQWKERALALGGGQI